MLKRTRIAQWGREGARVAVLILPWSTRTCYESGYGGPSMDWWPLPALGAVLCRTPAGAYDDVSEHWSVERGGGAGW